MTAIAMRHVGWWDCSIRVASQLVLAVLILTLSSFDSYGSAAQSLREQTRSLDRLVKSYPDFLDRHDGEYIYWKDGTKMAVSDGVSDKKPDERIADGSIIDQFYYQYPRGSAPRPGKDFDPGRIRNTAFFKKMYGDCFRDLQTFRKNLIKVDWLPNFRKESIYVTRINGVAENIKKISAEIEKLQIDHKRFATPTAGIFACRVVKDTNLPSMHASGAAIDLSVASSYYWAWDKDAGRPWEYKNRMPREIVDIFERYGFIWGGKWYHYDTMHFEYRPELLTE